MLPEPILVTGGAGFAGSTLTKTLVNGGQRVAVLDNLSFGKRELLPPLNDRCEFLEADVRDQAMMSALVRRIRPKTVIHLAAIHFIPYCNSHPVEAVEVNTNGTRNLLQACREQQPEQFFFASTAAVYPIEQSPFSEDNPVGPVDIYGHTKLMGEDLVRLFQAETGVRSIIGRFFNIYGPNETNPHLIPDIVSQLQHNGSALQLGNLEPVRDFIHVQDIANAIIGLLERYHGALGVFNIGSGRGFSVTEVVAACEQALGRRLPIVQQAERVRKVERLELVANITRLRQAIGWSPTIDFTEGIAQLLKESGCDVKA